MPKIRINDINFYYESCGQGAPIICISGFTGDHGGWQEVLAGLSQRHQVITFDNRGIGQSDCPDYPYTIAMMANDVLGLMQALEIESAHLVGNSMGGNIAQVIAHQYPQKVKSMVLSNSFMKAHGRLVAHAANRLELMKLGIPAEVMIHYLLLWVFSGDYLGQSGMVERLTKAALEYPIALSQQGYEHQLNALLTFDSRSWIHEIKVPCLVISSDEDLLAYAEESREMTQKITNARYFCFKNTGHLPQLEHPHEFNRVVLDFIDSL